MVGSGDCIDIIVDRTAGTISFFAREQYVGTLSGVPADVPIFPTVCVCHITNQDRITLQQLDKSATDRLLALAKDSLGTTTKPTYAERQVEVLAV